MRAVLVALVVALVSVLRSRASGWQDALVFVKPTTVVSWQRKWFRGG
jgi:hypothetical protein